MTRRLDWAILGACALLSACVAAPPPPPQAEYRPPPRSAAQAKIRHARRRPPSGAPGEAASACPWPAHAKPSAAHLLTPSTQVPIAPGTAQDAAEGCAVLHFGVSTAGTVTYIDVVSAKPDALAPVALKCLLAARFRHAPRETEALVRVEMRSPQPDQVIASLKLR